MDEGGTSMTTTILTEVLSGDAKRYTAMARRLSHSPNDIDDLLQKTAIRVWKHQDRFDPSRAQLPTWVSHIMRNIVIDTVRAERTAYSAHTRLALGIVPVPVESPEELLEKRDTHRTLHHALSQLPLEQQRVVRLRYFDEMSDSEIAAHTGCALGTIKSRLRLGLQALQRLLKATE